MNGNMDNSFLLFIPILPFLGFLINGIIGYKFERTTVGIIGCTPLLLSFMLSLYALGKLFGDPTPLTYVAYQWMTVGEFSVNIGFYIDRLSGLLINIITGVGFLIHFYSNGYMHHDKSVARFFAYLNLFIFAMLILVMSDNLVLMFLGWEGVGLCSYLLIGFWYKDMFSDKMSNADAGKKAFIVNRVGDVGFVLGIFLIFMNFGTLNFQQLQLSMTQIAVAGGMITAITLLLFVGATGKSAQIPLYVWLPDAMAGPTPVSALIHAATMVTAGVYMIARLHFLFVQSETTMFIVALVGTFTALFSATMGVTQNDIKKVLAYSTVSQLGYMFMAMGVGAFSSGIFHLMTHAFFKALLFLGAGSVILACHHEQDMRKMGALKDKIPKTFWMFAIGSLSLMGIPPFSGFFSKDAILAHTFAHEGFSYKIFWLMGVIGAGFTAFYTARMVGMTFFGKSKMTKEQESHVHEPDFTVVSVLMVLGFLSAVGGWFEIPMVFDGFSHFLDPVVGVSQPELHLSHTTEILLMLISIVVVATSGWFGFKIYSQELPTPQEIVKQPLGKLAYKLSYNKYFIDEIYDLIIIQSVIKSAKFLWTFVDVQIIDGIVNGAGELTQFISGQMRKLQTGSTNIYAFSILAGAVFILMFFMTRV